MRLLVLADIHGREKSLREILEAEPARDGVVIAGDLTQGGGERDAERILAALETEGGVLWAVPGNMDRAGVLACLERRGCSLHGAGAMVGGVGLFGVGASNPTPFHTPFEISEDEIGRLMDKGYHAVRDAAVKVLVSHAPPVRSALDRTTFGVHAGSEAVRRFLKDQPVDLCLCGHIHEAAGEDAVEGVRACNPGAAAQGHYALLDIENNAITVTRRKI